MSKRIIHIVGSFYPAINFGGPIFSTKRICDTILKEDAFDVEVISFNYKTPSKNSFLTYDDKEFIETTKKYNITWIDMRSKFRGFITFLRTSIISIKRADLIHLTGVFNFYALLTIFTHSLLFYFVFYFKKDL